MSLEEIQFSFPRMQWRSLPGGRAVYRGVRVRNILLVDFCFVIYMMYIEYSDATNIHEILFSQNAAAPPT